MTIADKPYVSAPSQRIAFIGLGTMGAPMAAHLKRAGHAVTVFNRTRSKAETWVAQHGGQWAQTPALAAQGASMVVMCVGNDDDLRQVCTGPDGVFSALEPGAIVVDHTTTSAQVAQDMAQQAAAKGIFFMDAPVSGGNLGAINGVLTVMCGGDADAFARIEPVIAAYAKAVTHLGGSGAGQLAKMVNQIAAAGLLQGLAEALAFGEKAGLDMPQVLNVISQGAASSWQMVNRGPTMLKREFDFGFAVDWMRKDLGLVLDEAERLNASLPFTTQVDQFYAELQAQGDGRADTSSLIKRLN